jgi:AmmeMemoRadiSam system protein B
MGKQRKQYVRVLANALRAIFEPEMGSTLMVISFNLSAHPDQRTARAMAGKFLRLFKSGKYEDLCTALMDGSIKSCGGAVLASLLLSGLVDNASPTLVSDTLLSAQTEMDCTVYYNAFSLG